MLFRTLQVLLISSRSLDSYIGNQGFCSLVPRHQIFRARPAALSKNLVSGDETIDKAAGRARKIWSGDEIETDVIRIRDIASLGPNAESWMARGRSKAESGRSKAESGRSRTENGRSRTENGHSQGGKRHRTSPQAYKAWSSRLSLRSTLAVSSPARPNFFARACRYLGMRLHR